MINNILYYLEQAARDKGEKIALTDGDTSVTYKEYCDMSRAVGTYIANAISSVNSPIAVLIDRNVYSVVAFMGVVYSGNFYVPVDTTMPRERVDLILDTLKPVMIIDARSVTDDLFDAVNIEEIIRADIDSDLLGRIRRDMIDIDPLYAIFTSGSTGVPKGVCVSHRSVIDLLEAFEEAFSFDESCVWGNQAPFDFDVSVKDIYNALYTGGTVCIIPKKYFKSPVKLIEYINDNGINTLIWAVSALRIISDFKALDKVPIKNLKNIMFSGEVMPVKSLNYWREHVTDARYVNLYGPTEITCNCTYYVVDREFALDEKLPAGKAFRNTRVYLRDEKGAVISKSGVIGEICVSGTCVANGYYNNPDKTSESFVQDALVTAYPCRMYATGDLGFYDENGDIIFASRKDSQIKHMGHRIELGEIEVALNSIDFLTIACCVYDETREKIVCFYEAENECKKQIVDELSKKLSKYMWPNVYEHFTKLPMSKNGKIDRVRLKKEYLEKNQ